MDTSIGFTPQRRDSVEGAAKTIECWWQYKQLNSPSRAIATIFAELVAENTGWAAIRLGMRLVRIFGQISRPNQCRNPPETDSICHQVV